MAKVVLVTGASSGIGKSIAEYLVTQDYTVYGTSRTPKDNLVNGVHFLALDVTLPESISACIHALLKNESRIDFLINNAGKGITGPLEEIPSDQFQAAFATNYFGPIHMIKAVLPTMRAQDSGFIINITSIAGYMGLPYRSAYSATKGALGLTTESLRMELGEFNIRLVNVAPGAIATTIAEGRFTTPATTNSPYKGYAKSLALMNEHVDAGKPPVVVAKAIYKIMNTENPKVHYRVGSFMERYSLIIKALLPSKVYENLLRKRFGI